jgi:hypothetical protein
MISSIPEINQITQICVILVVLDRPAGHVHLRVGIGITHQFTDWGR